MPTHNGSADLSPDGDLRARRASAETLGDTDGERAHSDDSSGEGAEDRCSLFNYSQLSKVFHGRAGQPRNREFHSRDRLPGTKTSQPDRPMKLDCTAFISTRAACRVIYIQTLICTLPNEKRSDHSAVVPL